MRRDPGRQRNTEFLTEQMNVMAAIAQAGSGPKEYPLGTPSKIEPLMRQSDLHSI
jgi:hypothetical protein